MLTDPGDTVIDPFAGSCVTGEVSERLRRRWTCIELEEDYLRGAKVRFLPRQKSKRHKDDDEPYLPLSSASIEPDESNYYRIPRPGLLWNGYQGEPLSEDGGKKRRLTKKPSQ